MKAILDIFASYTDCYLEYWNNFISATTFCEFYELNRNEFNKLAEVKESIPDDMPVSCLDFYMNRHLNNNKLFGE